MYSFGHVIPLGSLLLLLELCLVNSHPLEMETECPYLFSVEWLLKEAFKNCTPPKIYHCLLTENSDVMEICWVPFIIPAGHQMVYDLKTLVPKIEKCPTDTFEPANRWSNETVSFCKYKRSECNDQGEVEYQPGDETSDRICRCDYKRDYVESNFRQRDFIGFSKVHTDVQCGYFKCIGIRLQNYSCVEKCPEGMHYPNDSGQCQAFENDTNPKSTTITSTLQSITSVVACQLFGSQFSVSFAHGLQDFKVYLSKGTGHNSSLPLPWVSYNLHYDCSRFEQIITCAAVSNTLFERTSPTLAQTNRDDSELLAVKILVPICFFLLLFVGASCFWCWKRSHPKMIEQDKSKVIAETEQKLHKMTDYIGDCWNLAKKLYLTDAEIERIKSDHITCKKQCYNVLRTWKKKNTKAGWVKELLQACRDAGVDHMDEVEAIFKEDEPLLTNGIENVNDIKEHRV